MPKHIVDRLFLEAALVGLQSRRDEIEGNMARLREELTAGAGGPASGAKAKPRKRRLSAAGRRNIVRALRRRWIAIRAAKAALRSPGAATEKQVPAARKSSGKARSSTPAKPARKISRRAAPKKKVAKEAPSQPAAQPQAPVAGEIEPKQ
jgi:hypothetical protein